MPSHLPLKVCLIFVILLNGVLPAHGMQPAPASAPPPHTERLLQKRLNPRVYFDVRYPVFGLAAIDADIVAHATSLVDLNDFDSLAVESDEYGVLARERSLSYELHAVSPQIVSIVFSSWLFTSEMAGGKCDISAKTYCMASQKVMRLNDIFHDWHKAQQALFTLASSNSELEACRKAGFITQFSPDVTNFYLTETELVLVYSGLPPELWGQCSQAAFGKERLLQTDAIMRNWQQ